MPAQTLVRKRILNCIPSRNTETDWRLEHARAGNVIAAAPLPRTVDRRSSWWQIGDQGTTGSCVGWAAADSVLRWHFVKSGRLPRGDRLSVRFIWMASKETDAYEARPTTFIELEGTSLKAALDIARKFGVVSDIELPFASAALFPGESNAFYALASRLKIGSYYNLGRDPVAWRTWLAAAGGGPILTRLGVDATWDDARRTNGNLDVYLPDTVRGGHAVALVGYTADRFIVRNSWGTSWGDRGYAYASLAYARDAFVEAYGVAL